jgi:hypothetical protein
MSRDSSGGIATSYGLDGWGSIPSRGSDFSLFISVQTGYGTHPVSCPMGTGGSFPGVKRSEREVDHSPLSSAEVKNGEAATPLPDVFMEWCLIN